MTNGQRREAQSASTVHVFDGRRPPAIDADGSLAHRQRWLAFGVLLMLSTVSFGITLLALHLGGASLTLTTAFMAAILHSLVAAAVVVVVRRMSGAVWRERQLARLNGALAQEIIERKRVEAALREANHAAERANRTKSEFLASVSHELRTPLNAILGFSDILRHGLFGPLGNPRYEDYARDIHQSGRHLLDLINDILDIAKIEARKADLRESELDVEQISRSCMRMIAQRAEDRGLSIRVEIAPGLPQLYADQRAVKQILLNLLTNAVKFTPVGGRVGLSAVQADDGGIRISVSDSGIGMAPEEIPVALEPFMQTASSQASEEKGTGLGLTLAKQLTELHGGAFELMSEPGRGTTVTMHFPAERSRHLPLQAKSA